MKSQKNLIISFILGLFWLGEFFVYSMIFYPDGVVYEISLLQYVIMLAIVLAVAVFAIRSIVKKESLIGAIFVILADIFLLYISKFAYSGV